MTESESVALPLGDAPICGTRVPFTCVILSNFLPFGKRFYMLFQISLKKISQHIPTPPFLTEKYVKSRVFPLKTALSIAFFDENQGYMKKNDNACKVKKSMIYYFTIGDLPIFIIVWSKK